MINSIPIRNGDRSIGHPLLQFVYCVSIIPPFSHEYFEHVNKFNELLLLFIYANVNGFILKLSSAFINGNNSDVDDILYLLFSIVIVLESQYQP